MGTPLEWYNWKADYEIMNNEWAVAMYRTEDENGESKICVDIWADPLPEAEQWLMFMSWSFSMDNQKDALSKFELIVSLLDKLVCNPDLHPAVVLVFDDLEITDDFRIMVFEEWIQDMRANLQSSED